MAISKTGVEVDTNNTFENADVFEENGAVNSITVSGLNADTSYYVRAYVIQDGNKIYGSEVETFETESSGPDYTEPFYLENTSESETKTFRISKNSEAPESAVPTLTIEYSLDKNDWNELGQTSRTGLQMDVQPQSKVYLRCNTNSWCGDSSTKYNIISFSDTVGGNIMSLLYGSNFNGSERSFPSGSSYNFYCLFTGSNIIDSHKLLLPATTLTERCYGNLFSSCVNLINSPELPATTLANYCYLGMYYNCSSLVTAPVLPATTLTNYCYYGLFNGCSSLNSITTYANNISAFGCVRDWLSGVAATGTFHNLGSATYPSGTSGIPSGWTEVHN